MEEALRQSHYMNEDLFTMFSSIYCQNSKAEEKLSKSKLIVGISRISRIFYKHFFQLRIHFVRPPYVTKPSRHTGLRSR